MYRSPKACYTKAPVRRETPIESFIRQCDQVPSLPFLNGMKETGMTIRLNEGLKPGKPLYYKEVTNV